jgi:hypothetical protein
MLHGAYDAAFKAILGLTEKDVVPDVAIRAGIRYLLSQRAKEVRKGTISWWRSPLCSRRQLPPLPPPPPSCLPPPPACRLFTAAALPGPCHCCRRPLAPARSFIAACRRSAMSWPACRWRCRWGGWVGVGAAGMQCAVLLCCCCAAVLHIDLRRYHDRCLSA